MHVVFFYFLIGVPNVPVQPSIESSIGNLFCFKIKRLPPTKSAGPTYLSVIKITECEIEHNITTYD